jgi:colanic acid/amylovoran biosynthesis glycosyltransferase
VRIAFIINGFPTISETFILDQITGLIERGCVIDIYAHYLNDHGVAHPEVSNYRLIDRTFRLSPSAASSQSKRFARALREITFALAKRPGIVVRVLAHSCFGPDGTSLTQFYQILPFLTHQPYDVVHCHFGPNGILAAELKELGLVRSPLLTQFHGHDITSYVHEHGEHVYRNLFVSGDKFLCVSNRIKERAIQHGCDRHKARVHHTGVKTASIPFALRELNADGPVRVLTVARLVEKKGVEFGLRAVAQLIHEFPKLTYTIVGEGPFRTELTTLARELFIESHVRFVGAKTRDSVATLIKESDVLLAPSVTAHDGDEEGIPVVLMEALASGLPVVSTLHAGIPELVSHGSSGLLAPERDPEALAAHIRFLMSHSNERRSMAVAGRRTVEMNFDTDKLNGELLTIYQELAAKPGDS